MSANGGIDFFSPHLVELINNFNKVAGYKVNIQKAMTEP